MSETKTLPVTNRATVKPSANEQARPSDVGSRVFGTAANKVPISHPLSSAEKDIVIACQSERIEALLSSTSWKVTAPLRTIANVMRGLFARSSSAGNADLEYRRWCKKYDSHDNYRGGNPHHGAASADRRRLISVIMPVCDPPMALLAEAIDSVRNQIYPDWQLCIADDASLDPEIAALLRNYSAEDSRIRVAFRATRGHISRASNTALEMAQGDYVALLDHDDVLAPHALFCVAQAIEDQPDANIVYSDEDKITMDGKRYGPYFKCSFNRELMLCHNMISHLGAYRRSIVNEVGGFREGLEGSQDWDLALRVVERSSPDQIVHIPRVLYHWRSTENSTATSIDRKSYAVEAGRRAVADHLVRTKICAEVVPAPEIPSMNRVIHALPSNPPSVSVIIPTRDHGYILRRCVESVVSNTAYTNYEILIVDNESSDTETLAYLREVIRTAHPAIRVIKLNGPFNFSALNNAAAIAAQGEVLCLLNNDTEAISPNWLGEMVSIAMQPDVGAVGARLWYPDGTLQHAGIVLGIGGVAGHAHRRLRRGEHGYNGRAALQQEFSAVTAACLVVRKTVFQEIGGLDESLAVGCNDVDFCLRLKQRGYRNIWTPYAELIHCESMSRGDDDTPEKYLRQSMENHIMKERWKHILLNDPAYSPNLTLEDTGFGLAWPPRVPRF